MPWVAQRCTRQTFGHRVEVAPWRSFTIMRGPAPINVKGNSQESTQRKKISARTDKAYSEWNLSFFQRKAEKIRTETVKYITRLILHYWYPESAISRLWALFTLPLGMKRVVLKKRVGGRWYWSPVLFEPSTTHFLVEQISWNYPFHSRTIFLRMTISAEPIIINNQIL
jgi:hypothetical protein